MPRPLPLSHVIVMVLDTELLTNGRYWEVRTMDSCVKLIAESTARVYMSQARKAGYPEPLFEISFKSAKVRVGGRVGHYIGFRGFKHIQPEFYPEENIVDIAPKCDQHQPRRVTCA